MVSNYNGIVSDITKKKRTYEKNIAAEEVEIITILFLDLDKFKPTNDDYGHQN